MTKARVSTDEAAQQVVRRRSKEVSQYRAILSGGAASAQLHDEVAALSAEERQKLVDTEFSVEIKSEDALALKADLMIPWKKMRTMRRYNTTYTIKNIFPIHNHILCMKRWLKAWGIKLASEKSLREKSLEQIGNALEGELVPFCFPLRSGIDLRPAPLVYIPDLVRKVINMVEQNERYSLQKASIIIIYVCTCIIIAQTG